MKEKKARTIMNVKRATSILSLILSLIFLLSGCISVPVYKNYDFDPEDVVSVEIYDLRKGDEYHSGFHEKQEPVYTIPSEDLADFLSDLADIRFSKRKIIFTIAAVDPSFNFDEWVVRVNHPDGSFDLISSDHYGEQYDQNGKRTDIDRYGCNNDLWHDLIKEYLPEDLW
jgi:hypothetical protein